MGESENPRWGAPLCLGVFAVGLTTMLLHGGLASGLRDQFVDNVFHPSHAWAFDHISRMLLGEAPLSVHTDRIGYPGITDVRFIAWVPALLSIPLRPLFGPLGAYNAVLLLSPCLALLAAVAFLRRVTGQRPSVCVAAATVFALCPYILGCMANGQVAKLQHWVIPLFLLCMHQVWARPSEAWKWCLALFGVTVATVFTSPSYALQLPILAGGAVLMGLPSGGVAWLKRGALALGLVALGLLPAQSYYQVTDPFPVAEIGGESVETIAAFVPAQVEGDRLGPFPGKNAAELNDLLLGTGERKPVHRGSNHVAYLGLPLLLLAGLLAGRRGTAMAWILVGGGAVLALGPTLTWAGQTVTVGSYRLLLPSAIFPISGYPLATSGMYYRLILLSALGLSLLVAQGAGRWPGGKGLAVAVGLAILGLGDGLRANRGLWPFVSHEVLGVDLYEQMRSDPAPGAVLDLPIWIGPNAGDGYMLASVLHGRATTGLPRDSFGLEHIYELEFTLRRLLEFQDPPRARQALAQRGFRYVVSHEKVGVQNWPPNVRRRPRINTTTLLEGLGEPIRVDGMKVWRLEDSP